MKKAAFLVLAASFFKSYPSENKIYFTKDEQAFFGENDAINHAKTLREKQSDEPEVLEVTREEAEAAPAEKQTEETPVVTLEQAQAAFDKALAAQQDATTAYAEAKTKLDASPDNKTLQKSEASRKEKLTSATEALAKASGQLEALKG